MSDDNEKTEQAYPGHGPHSDGPSAEVDYSDPIEEEVEPSYVVTPGTETTEERAEIAEKRREELASDKPIEKDDDDDEVELTPESDDEEPVLPADDSPIHGEDTITPGSTDSRF